MVVFMYAFSYKARGKSSIVASIYNEEPVQINSITNADTRITVTNDRCESNCDSDGGMCIQLPCSSNGNLE